MDFGSPLPAQIGNMGITGVNPNGGTGNGNTAWITEQSGLVSKGRMDVHVDGATNLDAGKIVSDTGELKLDTGTLTHKDFEGKKAYEGFNADLGIDLTGGKGTDASPVGNSTLDGSYRLDDTRQTVRSTVGPGDITIRDSEKQASLEQSGVTLPLAGLNRDPDKAMEITRDSHVDLEVYLSGESVKKALEAGAAVTEIIGGALEHVREPALSKAIRGKEIDTLDALQQLRSGACGEQRGDAFWLWEWIVPSAHAADCIIKTVKGDAIVIHDRVGCIEVLGKALYAQTVGISANLDLFSKGLLDGVKDQGADMVKLVSDPKALAKSMSGVAFEFYQDPEAAAAKYGVELAAGLEAEALLYVKALRQSGL
ncbi:hypothetical protein J2X72_003051 [Phyllobacterium sp. 1468]|uniref:hypothetical protein n=1 Tax=Phyllobacterium sp. 1468 TaxID=2817759 RepID=UPI00285D28C8|nr:hypothetical protein [Phyllobacterium sp. 1468]MDR6634241.1 hypothetical protein [Phyllobacterium sp. 1468]